MKTASFGTRLLAVLLVLCVLVGLAPAVAIVEAKAETADDRETRAISDEISALITALKTEYGNFQIPQTKAKWVTNDNVGNLDGTYFMFLMARDKGAASQHRMINFDGWPAPQYDRLSENCYEGKGGSSDVMYWPSAWVTIGNWGSGEDTFAYINDNQNPANLLDYAVEFKRYTDTINYNTTQYFNEGSENWQHGNGWEAYINWEYKRDNWATSGNSTYVGFGPYLKIASAPSKNDIAYSIKSLHPDHAAAPYLGTTDAYGAVGYLSKAAPFFMKANADVKTFKIYKVDQNGGNFYTYWLGIDNYYSHKPINAHTISQIVREDKNQNTGEYPGNYDNQYTIDWELIQVSPYTLELYKALYKAKAYVNGGQGNYPAETYLGFLKYVQKAMADYKANRHIFNTDNNNSERTRMDSEAKDLLSYMALLDIEKNPESYMDISLEVLDFRADGLLFENPDGSSAYTMSTGAPAVNSVPRPGTNGNGYVEGLIEPYLKGGQIVYTQETINYIANALYTKHVTSYTASNYDSKWNKVFIDRVNGGMTLGSWDDTKTRIEGGENGGLMLYKNVVTCYDLAYYMLTNMWRETLSTDIVDTTYNVPYNTKISELTTMRLIKDSSGKYYFRSDLENGRNLDTGLIYSYPYGNPVGGKEPNLNSVSDLGFEKTLGNNTTGANETASHLYGRKNYHVMYHVKSAFVYYEGKNLSFNFTGDDDVYFFINGKSVCDIGGMHSATSRTCVLNEGPAKDLGLKDGDICTFDMYLIDRHITGINLNLTTNIEMVPVNVVTEKEQYEYTQAGVVGEVIREGSVVPDGTEVGYGFRLLNRSKHGISNLLIKDNQLNVDLTESNFSLGGTANVSDLLLVYRTYDPVNEVLCSAEAMPQDYGTLEKTLTDAVDNFSTTLPMAKGVYTITGLNRTQLTTLLKIGLPANVQLGIYGFHRTVYASVGGYTNKLSTTCTPLLGRNQDGTYSCAEPLNGTATRNLNVQALDAVTAVPMQVVLDYGKPIEFTVEEILKTLNYNPLDAKVAFLGIRETDVHGTVSFHTPAWLHLTATGNTFETSKGVYERRGGAIRFTPNSMLEGVDRLYALIRVTDNYLGKDWFLTVEIDVLPANMVYYEAETLAERKELTIREKNTDGDTVTESNTFSYKTDTVEKEPAQNVFDPTNRQDMIYLSFDKTGEDQIRYTGKNGDGTLVNPVYGNTNFDDISNYSFPNYMDVSNKAISDGNLTYTARNTEGTWFQIHTGAGSLFPLNYVPSDDDWVEVRLKIDGATANNGSTLIFCPEFLPDAGNGSMRTRPNITFEASKVGSGFFTLKFSLASTAGWPSSIQYTDLALVRRINLTFEGFVTNSTATFTFDYFYVGPEESCPSNFVEDYHSVGDMEVQDPGTYIAAPEEPKEVKPEIQDYNPNYDDRVLYFSFDNTAQDQEKYSLNQNYGSTNFDLYNNWRYNGDRSSMANMGTAGYMIYNVTATGEPWFETVQNYTDDNSGPLVLNYSPKDAEIVEIRVKFNGLYASNSNPAVQFFYGDGSLNAHGVEEAHIYHAAEALNSEGRNVATNNTWFTYTITLGSSFRSVSNVKSVRLAFPSVKSNSNGTITFDYIYIGPKATAPSKMTSDYLYFGFDNDEAAQYRYDSSLYGGTDFDVNNGNNNAANWRVGHLNSWTISGGALNLAIADEGYSWFESQRTGNIGNCVLNLNATKAEIFQVRLKFNNVQLTSTGATPMLKPLFGSGSNNQADQFYSNIFVVPLSDLNTNNKWFTYTIPLGDSLKSLGTIHSVRLYLDNMAKGSVSVDYVYVGPAVDAPTAYYSGGVQTYGYDSSYTLDSLYSDNTSLYTEGHGIPKMNSDYSYNYDGSTKYTAVEFSFLGTGFDLISRTGMQQATLRVVVYDDPGKADGDRVKTITVNNKGELELYQIPVVSVQGLDYGRYYVSIFVNDKVTAMGLPQLPNVDLSSLTRGNEFYLDAIRIYDPIDVSGSTLTVEQNIALAAYKSDKEAYQYIKEIRNLLLSKETVENLNGTLPGAVFVDVNSSNVDPETGNVTGTPSGDYTTAKIETYNKLGPKNEVYLAPGQAIAFRLAVDTNIPLGSLDIGAKTVGTGDGAKLAVGYVTAVNGTTYTVNQGDNLTVTLNSATAQYYETNLRKVKVLTHGSSQAVYLVIYNQSEGSEATNVISVTDIKAAYEAMPTVTPPSDSADDPEVQKRSAWVETAPVRFLVDGNAADAAAAFVKALWETPWDEETEPDEPTTEPDDPTPEPEEPSVVEEIVIRHSLDLASDISVNYAVSKSYLEGFENLSMVFTVPVYEGNTMVGTKTLTVAPVEKGGYYYFTLTGLTAVSMNDTVEAVLFMAKDGKNYKSLTDTYSIAQYAYSQLGKTGVPDGLKTLCAELLRYGGAAQTFKIYRTDSLVDANMTEEHKAWLSDADAVSFDNYNTVTDEITDSGVAWAGKSLLLDSKVAIRYILDLSQYTGEIDDLSIVLRYTNLNGEEKTVYLTNPTVYNESKGYYSLDFDGLLAAELRQPVQAAVYCGDTRVTGVLEYSASTYGNNKPGALGVLCKCLMAYSDSAKAFFTS